MKRIIQKLSIVLVVTLLVACQTTQSAEEVTPVEPPLISKIAEEGIITVLNGTFCKKIEDRLRIHKLMRTNNAQLAKSLSQSLDATGQCFMYPFPVKFGKVEMQDTIDTILYEIWSVYLSPEDMKNDLKYYVTLAKQTQASKTGYEI